MSLEDYLRKEEQKNPHGIDLYKNPSDSPSPLRYPTLEHNAYIWIILVVIIPIVLAVILCLITICVYRYRKKRAQEISATVLSNQNESSQSPQANIFVMEEQPPSYEILNEKNQNKNSITSNTYTSSSVHTVGTNVN